MVRAIILNLALLTAGGLGAALALGMHDAIVPFAVALALWAALYSLSAP